MITNFNLGVAAEADVDTFKSKYSFNIGNK